MEFLRHWVSGPLHEDVWVSFLVRWMAVFGIAFFLITALLVLLRKEKLLAGVLIVAFGLMGLMAYYEDQLEARRLMSRLEGLRQTWNDRNAEPAPDPTVATMPAEPAPPPAPEPAAKLPEPEDQGPPEGYRSVEVFAVHEDALFEKAARQIFNEYFGDSRDRFRYLPSDIQVELVYKFRSLLREHIVDEGEKGIIARMDYRPDKAQTLIASFGFEPKGWDLAFRVLENYSALSQEEVDRAVTETIRAKGRYFLGDGYYAQKHRIITEVERLTYLGTGGQVFHVKVLNPGRYFPPPDQGAQEIDLRAF